MALCLVLAGLLPAVALGHTANIPAARAKVQVDGSVELRVRFDVLAFALETTPAEIGDGPMNDLLDGPDDDLQSKLESAVARFRQGVRLIGPSGQGTIDAVNFPCAGDVHRYADPLGNQRLPVMLTAVIVGHLPAGARSASFQFPDLLGTVVLTTEMPYEEPVSAPVEPGSASRPLTIPTAREVEQAAASMLNRATTPPAPPAPPGRAAAVVRQPAVQYDEIGSDIGARTMAFATSAKAVDQTVKSPQPTATPAPGQPAAKSERPVEQSSPWFASLPGYIRMGFLHIVPRGLDHILFVLGLFLLSTRSKDLLKQTTAFTVAHSITLGLSLYGVFRLPPSIVEPIIALSIAFVAIENLFTTEMKAWRQYVVFAFGLVHGLGFAGALQDAGLPRTNFLTALIGFNAGVELGQLAVILGALALVGWFRSHQRYRSWVAMPASLAIALVAIVWTVERVL